MTGTRIAGKYAAVNACAGAAPATVVAAAIWRPTALASNAGGAAACARVHRRGANGRYFRRAGRTFRRTPRKPTGLTETRATAGRGAENAAAETRSVARNRRRAMWTCAGSTPVARRATAASTGRLARTASAPGVGGAMAARCLGARRRATPADPLDPPEAAGGARAQPDGTRGGILEARSAEDDERLDWANSDLLDSSRRRAQVD